jgi:hypothetical protein
MKKLLPCLFSMLFVAASLSLFSQHYSVSLIPDDMRKSANSVLRYEKTEINLSDKYEMTIKSEWAVTVLNSSGDAHINTNLSYNKNTRIVNMAARVFDATGKEIRRLKTSEIYDRSVVDGFSVFSDDRVKSFIFTPPSYPYTFWFSFEIKTGNTAFIPAWIPANYQYQSVLNSSYSLQYPSQWKLTVTENNFDKFSTEKNEVNGRYFASVSNIPASTPEYLMPSHEHFLLTAFFSLNHFSLEGARGTASNWQEFGQWYSLNMLSGRNEIPEATRAAVFALLEGIDDPIEKARRVFGYVQSRTRYVSVQIGIGGWRPMTVAEVDRTGYGDCKALSLYTKTLLELAGLPATYSIVYSGSRQKSIDTSRVAIQGDHVIVSIPLSDTTIWLETTSQTIPFGFLGNFTDNRCVLSLTGNQSFTTFTPNYLGSVNSMITSAQVKLFDDGGISAKVNLNSAGIQYDQRKQLQRAKKEDREKYYQKYWNYLQGLVLDKIDISTDSIQVVINETLELQARSYGKMSGNRMLITANVFNRISNVPPRYPQRTYPVEIQRAYTDEDTYDIALPDGFMIESLPRETSIESAFGSYTLKVEAVNDKLIRIYRSMRTQTGLFPPEMYQEYFGFIRDVSRSDQTNIVLIKQ